MTSARRPRPVPQRTCVGCRTVRPKRELVRVVRAPDGTVSVDLTGRRAGRGAYLCPSEACLDSAVKGKRLERALQRPIGPEVHAALAAALRNEPSAGPPGR